jgi:hypothetical protein
VRARPLQRPEALLHVVLGKCSGCGFLVFIVVCLLQFIILRFPMRHLLLDDIGAARCIFQRVRVARLRGGHSAVQAHFRVLHRLARRILRRIVLLDVAEDVASCVCFFLVFHFVVGPIPKRNAGAGLRLDFFVAARH